MPNHMQGQPPNNSLLPKEFHIDTIDARRYPWGNMIGEKLRIAKFMAENGARFKIPVYQRNYAWKKSDCRQLYDDLITVAKCERGSHFFGSVVFRKERRGAISDDFHIIDGQQRITTITLLFLAIRNLLIKKSLLSADGGLAQTIYNVFLTIRDDPVTDNIRLQLQEGDQEALKRLIEADEKQYIKRSSLTTNYKQFCEWLKGEKDVTIDQIYDAISKLEIIGICLDTGDNAQLIFESLNATGVPLSEGDKIRNYLLMGISPLEGLQDKFYKDYWRKIEEYTRNGTTDFLKAFLVAKLQKKVGSDFYEAFKVYVNRFSGGSEKLFPELLYYAELYERLLTCKSELEDKENREIDRCLKRLKEELKNTTSHPFLLEVLHLCSQGKISTKDVLKVLQLTESYLLRRGICGLRTNVLNQNFATLNRDVLSCDLPTNDYVSKLSSVFQNKQDTGRFPDDEEFSAALETEPLFETNKPYLLYILKQLERHKRLKEQVGMNEDAEYSIEHVMPQKLSKAWREELGDDAEKIHKEWLHRLANLTLTGYNSELGNRPFREKCELEEGGYINSAFYLNKEIGKNTSWGLPQLQDRCKDLVGLAKKIWEYPKTDFKPEGE